MNPIKLVDVATVAIAMVQKQKSCTSLEVKQELRNKGFWAKQSEISGMLAEVAEEEGWDVNDNGMFKTYELPLVSPIAKVNTPNPVATSANTSIKKQTGPQWEVNSVTDKKVLYFSLSYTRDQVRQMYAKTVGVKFVDTRSRKI